MCYLCIDWLNIKYYSLLDTRTNFNIIAITNITEINPYLELKIRIYKILCTLDEKSDKNVRTRDFIFIIIVMK